MISENVGVPVVASGGAGTAEHILSVLDKGKADAALIASMVHFGGYTIGNIKDYLADKGIPVRRV
jgi:cyclase